MSKVSWPPRDFKLPQTESKEDVFVSLLNEWLESHQFTKGHKYQLTLKWLQRYREAKGM